MSRIKGAAFADLLSAAETTVKRREAIADGAVLLRGFALPHLPALVGAIAEIAAMAPFRHMITPGGYRMSVAMTNCGRAGWITDRRGYRYEGLDPTTHEPWPDIPPLFHDLAARAAAIAGFHDFHSDACLVNRYEPGTRLTLHQDKNERDFTRPIVSVSLGLPAVFFFGGLRRTDRPRRYALESGDVVVWGGPARLVFHGIDKLAEGDDALCGRYRFNLTLRKAL
jgi:alkylated DNA repair protein (DNA oxidative demethylase)